MFHLLPPSGTPLSFSDLAKIATARFASGESEGLFTEKLARFTGSKYLWTLSSGRSALMIMLQGLTKIASPEKIEVVIPSWTCFSVAAAIARAGLKIRLVDIDPMTLDYDYNRLREIDLEPVLAIVACNLFGIVSDWSSLRSIAEGRSVFLIDDAAQSFGTIVDGRASGTLGDAGIYSLDRGKNLSTWSGGILLTDNDKLAAGIEKAMGALPTPGIFSEAALALKMGLASIMLRPEFYWIPNMVPFLGLGETIYSEEFSLARPSRWQAETGSLLIDRLDELNEHRSACASQLSERIAALGKFEISGSQSSRATTYLRLPVFAPDRPGRERAVDLLRQGGIAASTMYPATIRDIKGIEPRLAGLDNDYPGGKQVVERLFTLPTHRYVSQADIDKIVFILGQV